jgi:hypothetical protein
VLNLEYLAPLLGSEWAASRCCLYNLGTRRMQGARVCVCVCVCVCVGGGGGVCGWGGAGGGGGGPPPDGNSRSVGPVLYHPRKSRETFTLHSPISPVL